MADVARGIDQNPRVGDVQRAVRADSQVVQELCAELREIHGRDGREVLERPGCRPGRDRKSTRLNSSHGYISYAVFCLKKKKKTSHTRSTPLGSTHSHGSKPSVCVVQNPCAGVHRTHKNSSNIASRFIAVSGYCSPRTT